MSGQLDKWLWQLNQVKRSCGQVKRSSDLTNLCPEAMQAQCRTVAVVGCWVAAAVHTWCFQKSSHKL